VDFGPEEREAVERVLQSNWWGLEEEGAAFEKELATSTEHAIFVSSGSAALELGITASKPIAGGEVIVPATTFPTPIASILRNQMTPVVVDVGLDFQISPRAIREAITDHTVAILVVNVAGNIGNYDEYVQIAKDHSLKLWIDDCDGFGGTWDGKPTISFGEFAAISTHAAHIIATGQGGVVFTNDDKINRRVREMRDWGRTINFETGGEDGMEPEYQRYTYTDTGYNFQPLELQAAMGRVQLRKLDEFKHQRKHNFWMLYRELVGHVEVPYMHAKANQCWHTFPLLTEDRPGLVKRLEEAQIDWRPILAGNIARQPYYETKVKVPHALPMADKVFKQGIWLPVHPMHGKTEMKKIAKVVKG